jgi:Kef-type K+ transport system membrane component KefB
MIALVGTFLPILLAFSIALLLGYEGIAAVAAACTFAPTSLGIAMNVLRRSNIINTPVGQLIVAAAIIDDMIARKLPSYCKPKFNITFILYRLRSYLAVLPNGQKW